ncbi:hypothetical protein BH09ACT5_BH09ACT5_18410 [soil metagenome]
MTFSLPGLLLSLAVLAPNFLLLAFPARNPPSEVATGGWLLSGLERVGQAACLVAPALTGGEAHPDAWLAAVIVFVGCYYGLWARYFVRGREFALLYGPAVGIPVPMAVFPVLAFLAGAGWLHSWWLAGSAVVLGVGHIASAAIIARGLRAS